MRGTKTRVIIWGMAVCMAGSLIFGAINGNTRVMASTYEEKLQESLEKKEALEKQLEEAEEAKNALEQRKQEAQAISDELEENISDIQAYIEELDVELNAVTTRLNELDASIEANETELAQTKIDLVEAEETEAQQYETMKKRIRYMYENDGGESMWEMLLNADNLTDLLNQTEYVMRITEYDNTLLDRYELAKQEVATTKSHLEASLEELTTLKEEAEFEHATYLELSTAKAAQVEEYMAQLSINEELLAEYSNEISNQSEEIGEIYAMEEDRIAEEEKIRVEEEARLQRIAEEKAAREAEEKAAREAEEKKRKEQLASGGNATAAGVELTLETSINKMIWPLPGDGRTYSGFGYRVAPIAGASTYHRGVDIGGEYGAEIVSVLAGTVESTGYNWSSGNFVKVNHGDGLKTVYYHCSETLVSQGEAVMQGQVVALVGSTGISTGAHLHFGVMINDTYVDPLKYISY